MARVRHSGRQCAPPYRSRRLHTCIQGDRRPIRGRHDDEPLTGHTRAASFAYAGGHVAGLLVTQMSGSNFSAGDWYASHGTGPWRRRAAPAGGSASVAGGAVWLAGGPGNDRIYRSTDGGATWSRASLPRLGGGTVAGLAAPLTLGNQVVLPVTVANGSRTVVEFLASRDGGRSWSRLARVSLSGEVGAGVAIPPRSLRLVC
jgi:hypothetical protein